MAIETGMRKSELLNLTWPDIDFESRSVWVRPKKDTRHTWEWKVKDHDERELPLSENTLKMLARQQEEMEAGCTYVLVPVNRYRHIQELRRLGEWEYEDSRQNILLNFTRDFGVLRKQCGISKDKRFHDLRSTAISNWCQQGLNLEDVRRLAGHSSITITQEFYLSVAYGLMDRARAANAVSGAQIWQQFGSTGDLMSRGPKSGQKNRAQNPRS
jgi:integrase